MGKTAAGVGQPHELLQSSLNHAVEGVGSRVEERRDVLHIRESIRVREMFVAERVRILKIEIPLSIAHDNPQVWIGFLQSKGKPTNQERRFLPAHPGQGARNLRHPGILGRSKAAFSREVEGPSGL